MKKKIKKKLLERYIKSFIHNNTAAPKIDFRYGMPSFRCNLPETEASKILKKLVDLKLHKESHGESEYYLGEKAAVWEVAKAWYLKQAEL